MKYKDQNVTWVPFSCLKATEGGMSKADTLRLLKENGIICTGKDGYSPFVGHYGIFVAKKHEEKAAKLLWG